MTLDQSTLELTALVDSDPEAYNALFDRIVDRSLAGGRGYLTRRSLVSLLNSIILPHNLRRDRGWQDSPKTSPGIQPGSSTMNGVSLNTIRSFFDSVFIETAVQSVMSKAAAVNSFDWRSSEELSKQVLFSLCTSDRISNLFYLALIGSPQARYATQIMTVDPCAGYLLAQWCFESSPQDGSHFNDSGLGSVSTPTGLASPFPSSYATSWTANSQAVLEGGGAQFSYQAIQVRRQWIEQLTNPVSTNSIGPLQEVWKGRLLNDSNSQVAVLTEINEQFNLNQQQHYQFDDLAESDSLQKLGETYQPVLAAFQTESASGASGGSATENTSADVAGEASKATSLDQLLSIRSGDGGKVNAFGGSQLILNSDRIILNTRTDYLMLFGGAGVAVSSPNSINIESESSVTLFGEDGVFIGLPNRGEAVPSSTQDQPYEPLVLGNKLVDILEDLILTIRNATVLSPVGSGFFSEETLQELSELQARLPEIKSTFGYIDGLSYESRDSSSPSTLSEANAPADQRSAAGEVGEGSASSSNSSSDEDDFYLTNPLYNDPV